jgi:transposase
MPTAWECSARAESNGDLVEDIVFRMLAAGNQPNFRTISDFRKIHFKTLEGLFEQVAHIALEACAIEGRSRGMGRDEN